MLGKLTERRECVWCGESVWDVLLCCWRERDYWCVFAFVRFRDCREAECSCLFFGEGRTEERERQPLNRGGVAVGGLQPRCGSWVLIGLNVGRSSSNWRFLRTAMRMVFGGDARNRWKRKCVQLCFRGRPRFQSRTVTANWGEERGWCGGGEGEQKKRSWRAVGLLCLASLWGVVPAKDQWLRVGQTTRKGPQAVNTRRGATRGGSPGAHGQSGSAQKRGGDNFLMASGGW